MTDRPELEFLSFSFTMAVTSCYRLVDCASDVDISVTLGNIPCSLLYRVCMERGTSPSDQGLICEISIVGVGFWGRRL